MALTANTPRKSDKASTHTIREMKLNYSEFSYGYAFTENLIRSTSSGADGAPYFPNLNEEGTLGFDVHIQSAGCPWFFQFKLPELMIKSTAMEISKYTLSGIHTPFYRMYLMKRSVSKQHELLMTLEEQWPQAVYYATPSIPSWSKLSRAYASVDVHRQSVLFSPKEIGELPDDDQHSIAYATDSTCAWLCSDPQEIGAHRIEEIYLLHGLRHDNPPYSQLRSAVSAVGETILPMVPRPLREAETAIRERIRARRTSVRDRSADDVRIELDPDFEQVLEDLLVYRQVSRVALGVELLVSQPPQ